MKPLDIPTRQTEKSKGAFAVCFVLTLAVTLRVLNLLSNKAFWGDELFSVLLARKPFWDMFYGAISDVHPPGHLTLLHVFYAVFGNQDWVYRLPSLFMGCALVGLVYLLAQELFDKHSALLASFFCAISPYFIQLSNEARSYGLTTFAITFASYSFMKSYRTSNARWRRTYEISVILCTYINHFAWIWLLMVNVFLVLNGAFKKYFGTHVRILFYGLPALLLTIYQMLFSAEKLSTHLPKSISVFYIVKKIFAVLWHAATGYGYSGWSKESIVLNSTDPWFWLAIITYGSFLIAVIYAMFKAQKKMSLYLILSSLLPIILLCIIYPTRLESRYVSFLIPPLFIFAAAGFIHMKKVGFVASLPFVMLSLYFTFKTIAMPWDPIHREDYRAVIDYTFKVANENDAVCGLDRQVDYYGPKERKIHYCRYITEITPKSYRYKKIFLLEPSIYMDPKKDHARFDSAQSILKDFGYYLTESIDFSRNGVYTFVHIFEQKN